MSNVITLGEPMTMFVADEVSPLESANHFTKYLAGAEVNVCIGLKRLGHHISYITKLGEDPFGNYIHTFLENEKIDTSFVSFDHAYPTGFQLKSKVETGDPDVVYFRKGSAASHMGPEDIENLDLRQTQHIHVTGIPLALSSTCREAVIVLVKRGKECGIPVSFDPNLRLDLWSSHEDMVATVNQLAGLCDIFLPGSNEGEILTGIKDPSDLCDFYLNLGVKKVVVKLGGDGAYAKSSSEAFQVPGFSVEKVVDTVGAGDGFAVGVISGLIEGTSLREAVVRGNAIGAMQVMTPGDNDGLPTHTDLEHYLKTEETKR